MSTVDYLVEDSTVPSDQKFCTLSFWTTENKDKVKLLKVSGAFKYLDEAQYHVRLLKEPGHFNFAAEMGKWNAFDPLRLTSDNLESELNMMMKRNMEMQVLNTLEYDKRKYEKIIENLSDNLKVKKDEYKTEMEGLTSLKEVEEITQKESYISKIKEQMKTLETKISEYNTKLEDTTLKIKNFEMNSKNGNGKLEKKQTSNYENANKDFSYKTSDRVDNQNWFCVSFLSNQETSLVGIKVSGVFNTEDEAQTFAKTLRDINDSVNVFVGEMYKWHVFDPQPDSVEAGESEYSNPILNDTMKEKKNNEKKAQIYNEMVKNETIRKNIEDMIKSKQEEQQSSETVNTDEIQEQIRKLEEKKKEYQNKEKQILEKMEQLGMATKRQVPEKSMEL